MSYQFYLNHFFDLIFNFSPKIQIQNTFIDNYYHVTHFIQRIRAVVHDFIHILNDSFSHLQHLGIKKDKLCFKLIFSLIIIFPSSIPVFSGYAFFLMFSMISLTTEISVSNSSAITSGVLFLASFFSICSIKCTPCQGHFKKKGF